MKHMNRTAAATGLALLVFGTVGCAGGPGPAEPGPADPEPEQSESAAPETPVPTNEPTEESTEPTAEDVEGRWCAVDEGIDDAFACVAIDLPTATYDEGTEVDITAHDSPWDHGEGVFEFSMEDAPFGTYYPAGVPIEGFDSAGRGPDLVEEDRLWNSQDGFYAVRQ